MTEVTRREIYYLLKAFTEKNGISPGTLLYRVLLSLPYGGEALKEFLRRASEGKTVVVMRMKGGVVFPTGVVIKKHHVLLALKKLGGKVNVSEKKGKRKLKISLTDGKEHAYGALKDLSPEERAQLLDAVFLFIRELSKLTGRDILREILRTIEEKRKKELAKALEELL